MGRAFWTFGATLVGGALLAVSGVQAKTPAGRASPAIPIGSPADWLSPSDYPVVALRHEMEGTSTFRLSITANGSPAGCEITQSSHFDALDEAACSRLMQNARFTPARDPRGQAVAGTYANRVRWVLPTKVQPFRNSAQTVQFVIDKAGKQLSCRLIQGAVEGEEDPCRLSADMSQEFGLALRGASSQPTMEVVVETANALGGGPPAARISPVTGYEVRALQTYAFVIGSEGKMSECKMTEQRGASVLINDFCHHYDRWTYEVPFEQMASDGSVRGWAVTRILARTSK